LTHCKKIVRFVFHTNQLDKDGVVQKNR
jgi:hypothetical protein